MPGPPPKPTAQRKAEGCLAHRPLNENEPKPALSDGVLQPPPTIDHEAKREWERIAPILHAMGLLTELDATEFMAYCQAVGDYVTACGHIDKEGHTTQTENGIPRVSPWWKIRRDSVKQIHESAARFGLSPSDRTRIEVDPTPATDDLAAFNAEE